MTTAGLYLDVGKLKCAIGANTLYPAFSLVNFKEPFSRLNTSFDWYYIYEDTLLIKIIVRNFRVFSAV